MAFWLHIYAKQAVRDIATSYKALVDLFESIEHFLKRLDIYTKIPPTPVMAEILVKIMVELLSSLGLATKQIMQRRSSKSLISQVLQSFTSIKRRVVKFVKKLFGENDVEAVLQRLDRLTQDEARATAAQTLVVVYGLIQNMRTVMDGM